jgi:hypothetical protein
VTLRGACQTERTLCHCGSSSGTALRCVRKTYPDVSEPIALLIEGEGGGYPQELVDGAEDLWMISDPQPRTNPRPRTPGPFGSTGWTDPKWTLSRMSHRRPQNCPQPVEDDRPKIEARRPLDRDRSKAYNDGAERQFGRSAPLPASLPPRTGGLPRSSVPPPPARPSPNLGARDRPPVRAPIPAWRGRGRCLA